MALTFYYSTVNAGKTAKLILDEHAYSSRGSKTLVLLPSVATSREGGFNLNSRAGLSCTFTPLSDNACPYAYFESLVSKPEVVFVDEAQFLSPEQIKGLCDISDKGGVPVFAFGLRTDFLAKPFEGSTYLMAWADRIMEVPTPSTRERHTFATMNIKINPDTKERVTEESPSVDVGFHYEPVSRKYFDLSKGWSR